MKHDMYVTGKELLKYSAHESLDRKKVNSIFSQQLIQVDRVLNYKVIQPLPIILEDNESSMSEEMAFLLDLTFHES